MVDDGNFLHLTCKPTLTIKTSDEVSQTDLQTVIDDSSNPALQINQAEILPYAFSIINKAE
jgi:hypothetical protein